MAFTNTFKYDVFLSYARVDNQPRLPERMDSRWVSAFRDCLKRALDRKLGRTDRTSIFFDTQNLDSNSDFPREIDEAISSSAVFVAVISRGYFDQKCWCKNERERFLAALGSDSAERRAKKRLWLILIDETPREQWQAGFFPDIVGKQFFDNDEDGKVRLHLLGNISKDQCFINRVEDVAAEIAARLSELNIEATHPTENDQDVNADGRIVFLAECTPDLEDDRRKLAAFLKSKSWHIVPDREYSPETYASDVRQDLKPALAFIQLLGRYPWKYGGYDVVQFLAAEELKKCMFRHRNPDIDLATVPESHRPFLSGPAIIARSFEEFKGIVERGLNTAFRANQPENPQAVGKRRVFVSVHARNPDRLWAKAFGWLYENRVYPERITPKETLKDVRTLMQCHGVLLLCDDSTVTDESHSNRHRLRECIGFQADIGPSLPIGVAFWRPPKLPPWSKLIPTMPEKLHPINGNSPNSEVRLDEHSPPTSLKTFLADVIALPL